MPPRRSPSKAPPKPLSPGEFDLDAFQMSALGLIEYLAMVQAIVPDDQAPSAGGARVLDEDELDLVYAVKRRCDRRGVTCHVW